MTTIDERIVSMVFENAKFEAGIAKSMDTLKKFNDALGKSSQTTAFTDIDKAANKVTLQGPMSALDKLRGRLFGSGKGAAEGMSQIEAAGNKVQLEQPVRALDKVQSKTADVGTRAVQGFSEIESAASKVTLEGLSTALDGVTGKFSVLKGAASVALGNIASQATMRGGAFAKSFALGPLQQGFGEYQTNLQSIQTILANTQGQKVSGLDNVNKALGELNTYSDQTIYNFSEMAKNIGTFTAAGVDLPRATASIKGIANLAALSGSNSQQASTAMYQLSQAISAGRVGLQDWNSVVNAGMGGAVFQKSLMRTAENMGALEKGAVKIDKATGKATVNGESFRNSIMAKPGQESWLSSDVLTETLKQMTGDMSDAELKTQGFSEEQIKAIQAQAKTAKAAATEVKTLPQVWDVARETIGSGWAQSAQLIFGNFNESKKTFTEMSNTVNGFINSMSHARNQVLKDWHKFGGRTTLIRGLKVGFRDLLAVMRPIGKAFHDIFPRKTGGDLLHLTRSFVAFMAALRPTKETTEKLTRTFRGLFALVHTGLAVIKGFAGLIQDLLVAAGVGQGGILDFTGSMGDFLVSMDYALTKGGGLTRFFKRLAGIIEKAREVLHKATDAIAEFFGSDLGGTTWGRGFDEIARFGHMLTPTQRILQKFKDTWTKLTDAIRNSPIGQWLKDKIAGLGTAIGSAFSSDNINTTMTAAQTAFVGGIFIALKKAIKGGSDELVGVLKGINGVLGGLTGNLQAMQQKLKAQAITQIAISIGILAASVAVLATIDPKRLASAMTAIAVGLAQLMGAMKLMTGGLGKMGTVQLPVVAASLIGFATAVTILAGAMKIFATMSWEEIGKGLAGVGGSLAAIGRGMMFLPKGPRMIAQATAITIIAVALNVLAIAVKQFASMSWEELGRGLAGVMFALVALTEPMYALSAMGPGMLLAAPALIGIGIALNIIAQAVKFFGDMDLSTLAKGILGISVALDLIGAAMWLMPPGPMLAMQAAGLVILSVALNGIALAMRSFGSMGVGEIAKSLIVMGGALGILGVALYFMIGTLPGAAALMAAALALAVLAPTLGFLGQLKISTIVKGLIAMAAVLALLAVAGIYAAPGIAALGTALLPLAGVFIGTALAVLLFAKALDLMGSNGSKGVAVMMTAIVAFVALLPNLIVGLLKGLLEVIEQIAVIAPKALAAIGKMLGMIIAFVIKSAPQLALAIGVLVDSVLLVLLTNVPKLIDAGAKLFISLLDGLIKNLPLIIPRVGQIIFTFLSGLAAQAPRLIDAGARLIGTFLTGIGNRIGGLAARGVMIVAKLLGGVASKIGSVATAGMRIITSLVGGVIKGIGHHITTLISAGAQMILSVLTGISNAIPKLIRGGLRVARSFLNGLADGLTGLADIGFKAIIRFLHGLEKAIRENFDELFDAGAGVADAIVDGLVDQFGKLGGLLRRVMNSVFSKLPGWAKKILGIHSPSKVFMEIGHYTMMGFIEGIDQNAGAARKTVESAAGNVVGAARRAFGNASVLDGIMDVDPTIRPILDLSQVKKEAGTLGDITKVPPIKATGSIGQALAISSEKARIDNDSLAAVAALNSERPTFKYEQTINSPEPLSTAEIYRRTNNTLSKIRRDVGL